MLYAGFDGRYTNKAGKTAEGSATFFRKDRYRAVALKEMKMNELFAGILADPSAHAIHSQFLPLLQSSPTLVQALSRVRLRPSFLLRICKTACVHASNCTSGARLCYSF